jgi:hypothetical protein
MSSDFLYSSYMRYKADTDAVATWLLNTAMGRGYTVATTSIAPNQLSKALASKAKQGHSPGHHIWQREVTRVL